jgi:hypothetical protein
MEKIVPVQSVTGLYLCTVFAAGLLGQTVAYESQGTFAEGSDQGGLQLGGHEFSIDFSVAAPAVAQASQLPKQFSLVTSSLDLTSSRYGSIRFSCNAGAGLEIASQSNEGTTFVLQMCVATVAEQQLALTIALAYSNGKEPPLPDMPLPISYTQKLDLTLSSAAYSYGGSDYNLSMTAGAIGANCPNCPAVSLSPSSSSSSPIHLSSKHLRQTVYIIPSNGTQLSYALTTTSSGGSGGRSWFSVAPASDFGLTGSSAQAGAVPVTITAIRENLGTGPYTGSVTVYTPDSDGVPYPQTIYVTYVEKEN